MISFVGNKFHYLEIILYSFLWVWYNFFSLNTLSKQCSSFKIFFVQFLWIPIKDLLGHHASKFELQHAFLYLSLKKPDADGQSTNLLKEVGEERGRERGKGEGGRRRRERRGQERTEEERRGERNGQITEWSAC